MRRLWYNGTVASMDGAMRRYEAVGAEDGRLTFLGSVQEALAQVWDETRDLQGGMVLPGFTDSHMHLLHYAMIQKNLSLFGVASIGEIIDRGRARIERDHPSYLIGMGWNQETMAEGRLVTREDLDRISTDIPVCMLRTCLHIGACNSIMLERIRALEDVAPEVLALVDFANGILREDAARLYMKVLPQADDAYVKELIRTRRALPDPAGPAGSERGGHYLRQLRRSEGHCRSGPYPPDRHLPGDGGGRRTNGAGLRAVPGGARGL